MDRHGLVDNLQGFDLEASALNERRYSELVGRYEDYKEQHHGGASDAPGLSQRLS